VTERQGIRRTQLVVNFKETWGYCMENSLWTGLWTSHKTDCGMIDEFWTRFIDKNTKTITQMRMGLTILKTKWSLILKFYWRAWYIRVTDLEEFINSGSVCSCTQNHACR
jgi:hypothetical protein